MLLKCSAFETQVGEHDSKPLCACLCVDKKTFLRKLILQNNCTSDVCSSVVIRLNALGVETLERKRGGWLVDCPLLLFKKTSQLSEWLTYLLLLQQSPPPSLSPSVAALNNTSSCWEWAERGRRLGANMVLERTNNLTNTLSFLINSEARGQSSSLAARQARWLTDSRQGWGSSDSRSQV